MLGRRAGYHNVSTGRWLLSYEVAILGMVFRPAAEADYFHLVLNISN